MEDGVGTDTNMGCATAATRELRMEDSACSCLDHVKMAFDAARFCLDDMKMTFDDCREVCNEFLDIMMNFKCQTEDIPGVIACVSKLFCGHDQLVFGKNTFLLGGHAISVVDLGGINTMMTSNTGTAIRTIGTGTATATNTNMTSSDTGWKCQCRNQHNCNPQHQHNCKRCCK